MRFAKNISALLFATALPLSAYACEVGDEVDSTGNAYADMVLGGEGGGNWAATNGASTATGAFQFMYGTLQELGYISSDSRSVGSDLYGDDDWSDVTFTGQDGVWSRQDFMDNQAAQLSALDRFTQNNLNSINANYGDIVNGVPLTEGGAAYAAHFLGAGGFNQWASCGYQASCLPTNILEQNAAIGDLNDINDMLMKRLAEGAGVDPSCINTDMYDGFIPPIVLMPWI